MIHPINIWTYWEGPKLPYIDLCLRTVGQVCAAGIRFNIVTPETLDNYVPPGTLSPRFHDLPQIGTKACAIRAALLAVHGGWWWDADTIGIKSPIPLMEQYPGADVLYMSWSTPPRRILNGYIYVRPGADMAQEWLSRANHMLETDYDLASTWLELGEKIITPLIDGREGCHEVDRRLFLPIEIDNDVRTFFQPGDPWGCVDEHTICYGLNHSWFVYHRPKEMSLTPEQWADSPLLVHRLLHCAYTL